MILSRRRFMKAGMAAAGGALLLGTYTVFIERLHFQINRYRINLPHLPEAFDEFRILLAHNPDSVDSIDGSPMDLVLSGHTHGGQIVLPFVGALKLPVKNKIYSQGLIPTKTAPSLSQGESGPPFFPSGSIVRPKLPSLNCIIPKIHEHWDCMTP